MKNNVFMIVKYVLHAECYCCVDPAGSQYFYLHIVTPECAKLCGSVIGDLMTVQRIC